MTYFYNYDQRLFTQKRTQNVQNQIKIIVDSDRSSVMLSTVNFEAIKNFPFSFVLEARQGRDVTFLYETLSKIDTR